MKVAMVTEERRLRPRRLRNADDHGYVEVENGHLRFSGRHEVVLRPIEDVAVVGAVFPWGRVPLVILILLALIVASFALADAMPPWDAQEARAAAIMLPIMIASGVAGIGLGWMWQRRQKHLIQVRGRDADGQTRIINLAAAGSKRMDLLMTIERGRA